MAAFTPSALLAAGRLASGATPRTISRCRNHSFIKPARQRPGVATAQQSTRWTSHDTCPWANQHRPEGCITGQLHRFLPYNARRHLSQQSRLKDRLEISSKTVHDRTRQRTLGTIGNGQSSQSEHPREGGPATTLTLYAGVSIFTVLLVALSHPFSFIHIGQQDNTATSADCPETNPADPPRPPSTAVPAPTAGDDRDPSLPRYRLVDIRKHDANSAEPWVTSGDKVYDITDWVPAHPGGDVILRAAGHSIDPYWAIFTIHKAPHVREILDTYLIGFVDAADLDDRGQPRRLEGEEGVEDPFAVDPVRDSRLIVHTEKPCNAEPPSSQLVRDFTTPNELFYVRNHMWVPVVDPADADQHRLTIELPDGEVRDYTLDELRTRFPVHRIAAVMQCSGNRRSDMTKSVGPTNGLQWAAGAISNAVWEGVLLRDVLADAGLRTADDRRKICAPQGADADDDDDLPELDSLHVQMSGMEAYAASIPLPVAMDPRGDVLLAFGMNGQPLPRDHGYPLRAVVPGYVAARSVKWLSRIVVSDEESPSQWQRRDYKLFGPNEGGAPNWDRYPAIQEMPITSAITSVWVGKDAVEKAVKEFGGGGSAAGDSSWPAKSSLMGSRAAPGVRDPQAWQNEHYGSGSGGASGTPVAVAGYAYSGGGREIVRVDVSVDGGRTWDQAELLDQSTARDDDDDEARQKRYIVARGRRDWAWKRWRYAGVLDVWDVLDSPDKDKDKSKSGGQRGEIVVKATDSAYNTQPERHDGIYNARGNLATAWHRVTVDYKDGRVRLRGCGFGDTGKPKK